MKYSVGDMFIAFNSIVIITAITVPFSSETLAAGQTPAYSVTIEGRESRLRWYDRYFDRLINITCPVLKELHS
jgi:hypothetical protein